MKVLLIVIVIVIFLCIFINEPKSIKQHEKEQLDKLIKQTSRWLIAAQQDKNDLIAVLHINYAVGYWWAIQDIFDDYEIDEVLGGINNRKAFENKLLNSQELITKKVSYKCPQFTEGLDDFLAKLGGDK